MDDYNTDQSGVERCLHGKFFNRVSPFYLVVQSAAMKFFLKPMTTMQQ